jgi:Gpi18-like mannosyltransferase
MTTDQTHQANEPATTVSGGPPSDATTPPAAATPAPGPGRIQRMTVIAVIVLGALAVRAVFFHQQSGDYLAYFSRWYDYILTHGRFAALKTEFANYNVPYLYLLTVATYLPVPALYAIKSMSVVFDFVLAFFAYRIVDLRYPGRWWPVLAGAIVLFLPTVVLNSSWWAQADATYSAFGVGGLYFLLRRRPWTACLFFGLAFAFKLQIVFLFPLLLLMALRRYVPWRALLLIPLVYLALDVPALLLGADPKALLTVYVTETGTYDQLTLNAPNVYQYLGNVSDPGVLRDVGIAVTGVVLLALIIPVALRRIQLTPTRILLAATVCAVLVPYLLPAMHERYFYLADTLTVLCAFYLPRRLWYLPIVEQFASLFAYLPFLLMSGGFGGRGRTGGSPGGARRFPGGRFPGGTFPGGRPGAGGSPGLPGGYGTPGGGSGGSGQLLPTPGTGSLGGGRFGGGGGFGGGQTGHTIIAWPILATAMLVAVVVSLWAAFREFRGTPADADRKSAQPTETG